MERPQPSPADPLRGETFMPVPVGDVELSDPAVVPECNALGQVSLLVRMHGEPLGTISLLDPGAGRGVDLTALASERFRDQLVRHLLQDGVPIDDLRAVPRTISTESCPSRPAVSTRLVSVVICTLGEDERLVQTVESVLAQTHRRLELIVVDNRPESGQVRRMLAGATDGRLRIVAEHRRGLSVARNTGLAVATGSIVAFTDDDAFADAEWVTCLVRPFDEHPSVVCATGLVLPAELATPAQTWFEQFGAFDKGFQRVVWSDGTPRAGLERLGPRGEGGVLFPYSAGVYGSGNNMAFRADWLRDHNGFDVALGAGSKTRGGEDLEAFLTVVLAGGVIVYEPRAVIRHYARSDMDGLRTQMYGYGSGMSAVIFKHLVAGPRSAGRIVTRIPAGLRRLLDPRSSKNEAKTREFPRELARAELAGYAAGPALYLRSRRDARTRRLHEHLTGGADDHQDEPGG